MGGQLLAAVNDLKEWAGIPNQVALETKPGCKW